jgi:twinkle protein
MQSVQNKFKDETLRSVTDIESKVRGISPQIFKQFSYYRGPDGEHIANMYNIEGKVVAQKIRYKDKTFSWVGKAKEAIPFGMNQWRSGGKRITITEGELDAMSISEALGGKYPVISISNGAATAKKDLKKHMEYLNTFDEVVLWFDNDEPGRKAVAEVSALFPPGKVYTVDTGDYKDANEILKKSGVKGVLHYYYEVKKFTPSGIVNANEGGFEALMEDKESDEVYTTQFTGLEIAKGAMTTFVSGSGMGKSTIVREIGHHLLTEHGLTVGHVALEENNSVSKRAYLGIELNESIVSKKKWHIYKEKSENITKIKGAYDKVIGTDRLFLYNHFGSLDSDSLLNKLRYLAVGAGCDIIVLDHISIVVSGLEDMGDNERRVIDVLMTKLRSLVEETGVGMVLVSHLKRPSGDKGHEDGVQVSLSHLRGSGSIAQLSDKVIGLEGNQQDEEHSNERVIRCLKDREEGERVGILGHATYQPDIGRLIATDVPEDTEGGFTDENSDF